MKKNCYNCKHLKWIDGDINDQSGFDCMKRSNCTLSITQQDKLYDKLRKKNYRNKSKVCCDLK